METQELTVTALSPNDIDDGGAGRQQRGWQLPPWFPW